MAEKPLSRARYLPGICDILWGAAVFHLVNPTVGWAYLDPISGSLVLQVLAAAFLGAAATLRRSRAWLVRLFDRFRKS